MATLTKTPTSFTIVSGTWNASSGTQLAAIQTDDTIYVNGDGNNDELYAGFDAFTLGSEYIITNVRISVDASAVKVATLLVRVNVIGTPV